MAAAVLLWDFGDTLVDERWMRTPPVGCPTREAAWLEVMAHSAYRWNPGAVTSTKIFDALSVRTGMAREQVEAHACRCCEQLVFNETAWRVAKERWLPPSARHGEPDLFTDHIVPRSRPDSGVRHVVGWRSMDGHQPHLSAWRAHDVQHAAFGVARRRARAAPVSP